MLDLRFTAVYVGSLAALLAAEGLALHTRREGGTLTAHWRYVDFHAGRLGSRVWRIGTTGCLVWLMLHWVGHPTEPHGH